MRLSIVTICWNDKKGLMKTIKSVRDQIFNDYEYIIVDGGSKDGSIDLIENNLDIISAYFTDVNSGIYDAMNYGINKANGDYVHLLNSGDTYINKYSLLNVFDNGSPNYFCSSVLKFSFGKQRVWIPKNNYQSDFVDVAHPGLIVKRDLYRNNLYSTKYRIVSDALFISSNVRVREAIIIKDILVEMSDGGISSNFSFKHEIEKFKLLYIEKIRPKEKVRLTLSYLLTPFRLILNKL